MLGACGRIFQCSWDAVSNALVGFFMSFQEALPSASGRLFQELPKGCLKACTILFQEHWSDISRKVFHNFLYDSSKGFCEVLSRAPERHPQELERAFLWVFGDSSKSFWKAPCMTPRFPSASERFFQELLGGISKSSGETYSLNFGWLFENLLSGSSKSIWVTLEIAFRRVPKINSDSFSRALGRIFWEDFSRASEM